MSDANQEASIDDEPEDEASADQIPGVDVPPPALVEEACTWLVERGELDVGERRLTEGAYNELCKLSKDWYQGDIAPVGYMRASMNLLHEAYCEIKDMEQERQGLLSVYKGTLENLQKTQTDIGDLQTKYQSLQTQFATVLEDYNALAKTHIELQKSHIQLHRRHNNLVGVIKAKVQRTKIERTRSRDESHTGDVEAPPSKRRASERIRAAQSRDRDV